MVALDWVDLTNVVSGIFISSVTGSILTQFNVKLYLTFNLIEAFARCASGGGLCLADVWAGRLQFCTPDTKAYAE